MTDEKHIIKKAVLELHIPSAKNAMDIQNKSLRFFKQVICPLLEKIIANYSNINETIRIDKLELDIKKFDPDHFTDNELRIIEQQIEEKLIRLISEERNNSFSAEIVTAVKKISKEKADEELFLYLLKTGNLPWWAKTEQPVVLEALAQAILKKSSGSFKRDLIAALALPVVRTRIVHRLSASTIERIISIAVTRSADQLSYIHGILNFAKDSISSSEKLLQQLYEYVLNNAASSFAEMRLFISGFIREKNDLVLAETLYRLSNKNAANKTTNKTAVTIKQALADVNEHFSGSIKKMFDVKDVKLFFDLKENEKSSIKGKLNPEAEKGLNTDEEIKKQPDKKAENKTKQEEEIKKRLIKKQQDIINKNNKTNPVNEEEEYFEAIDLPEEIGDYFIKNSGLIILSPYLPAFFKELGLYNGKEFLSAEAKERAACLLHYLTTGSEENFEEHEMILNKVLCDIEISMPLTLQFIISGKEKEECLDLLQAVANNWPALKGTSGPGMRDAFFMRDGILEQQSNGWNLKIEKTTIDILLDKLPWGISIIQMPWSREMIFVSW